jgi:ribosomal protein S18 acetylase RimI-like enzyme
MQPGRHLRDVTASDARAIVGLLTVADRGEPGQQLDEVAEAIGSPEHHAWVIDAADGGIAAYGWARRGIGHASVDGDVVLHPGSDPALRAALLARARIAAAEIDPLVPYHVFAEVGDAGRREVYDAAGGVVVRRFLRMQLGLADSAPEQASLPAGVQLAVVGGSDDAGHALYQVLDGAFADHFGAEPAGYEQWLAQAVRFCPDRTLWWLATVEGRPAAGLCGCPRFGSGYVASVGTLAEFRGRGLARALLLAAFAEFHRRGHRSVTLNVDATNPTGAVALYESLGMTPDREELLYEFG